MSVNLMESKGVFFDMEKLIIQGDLARLSSQDRVLYYKTVCKILGLNPFTKPFDYITLNGKLTLYAKREATEQLRKIHNISIKISNRELVDDVYIVTALATDANGRCDESIGAVNLSGLKGENKANAMMRGETKSKRRVTLSICGLGLLDETEVSSVPNAKFEKINLETGEIISNKSDNHGFVYEGVSPESVNVADNILNKVQKKDIPSKENMIDKEQMEFLTVLYEEFVKVGDWIDKCLEKLKLQSMSQLTVSQADKIIDKISEKYPDAMSFWSNRLFMKQNNLES